MVGQSASLDHLHRLQLFETCLLCNLVLSFVRIMLKMSYVGDVADISYLIAEMAEEFDEHVICHAGSGMAEVCVSIYSRTADIKAYMSFIDGLEDFFLSRKRIGYI